MNWQNIKAVFYKDWRELLKSRQAMVTLIMVPVILMIILPAGIIISTMVKSDYLTDKNAQFMQYFPQNLLPPGLDELQKLLYAMLVIFNAPLFLLIPIMAASIIAANSFAGEKERKTLEGLLYTPVTDKELVLGKILVALAPAILISWLCFLVYGIMVNAMTYEVFHRLFFPTDMWIVLVLLLVPGMSFLSLSIVVAVSQRASGTWEAQQISALLVLPVIAFLISQSTGIFYVSLLGMIIIGLVILLIDAAIFFWIVKSLDRERMLTKLV
ncbi:ABC transporter permease [candidate division KSB1 bacterium]|nr:ABC transporter permease [candidate division KSB1 bacterium]